MKTKIVSLLVALIVILSCIVIVNNNTVKAAGEVVVVWLVSDPHIGNGVMPTSERSLMWDAINDTNAMSGDDEVDYAWIVGDITSNAGHWDEFEAPYAALSPTVYKNITIGNHDFDWDDDPYSPWYGRSQGAEGGLWFSYDLGNIRVCVGGDERTVFGNYNGYGECFMYGGAQRNWYNTTIQNASNYSMNTWIIFHQPLNHTVDRSDEHTHPTDYFCICETNSSNDQAPLFNQMMKYLETNSMSPAFYISGHTHVSTTENTSDQIQLVEKYGTWHLNTGSITGNGGTPNMHAPCSRYLYLTNGSKTVTIKSYNHTNNSFVASRQYSIEMPHNFILDEVEGSTDAPEFASINGQANDTIIYNNTRYFNWSNVSGSALYDLRIGNSTSAGDVTDIFLQLSNITVSGGYCTNTFLNTSPSVSPRAYNYWEENGYCHFYLPYHYNITYLGYHYYQVRASS